MTPTKEQKARRYKSFKFTYEGAKCWFYLCKGASFHQPNKNGQHDVFGIPVKTLIKALKKCGYIALMLCVPVVVEAKDVLWATSTGVERMSAEGRFLSSPGGKKVVTDYDDFLKIIAKVEHSEKLRNQAMAEKGVLIKLTDEQKTIIKVQAEQIQACEGIMKTQEQLGATQEEINKAVEAELLRVKQELEREKRLSRYKSEFVGVGSVILGILWVVN